MIEKNYILLQQKKKQAEILMFTTYVARNLAKFPLHNTVSKIVTKQDESDTTIYQRKQTCVHYPN